jgi:hypothetical protein
MEAQSIYRCPDGWLLEARTRSSKACLATKVEMKSLGSCVPSCPTDHHGSDTEHVSEHKTYNQRPCEKPRNVDLAGNNCMSGV